LMGSSLIIMDICPVEPPEFPLEEELEEPQPEAIIASAATNPTSTRVILEFI
jgi:hypothetical protein